MYDFFIYSRPAGKTRFALTDLARGYVGMGKLYAPRYKAEHLDALKKVLMQSAADNPGAVFQLRRLDGKTIVFSTANPSRRV